MLGTRDNPYLIDQMHIATRILFMEGDRLEALEASKSASASSASTAVRGIAPHGSHTSAALKRGDFGPAD